MKAFIHLVSRDPSSRWLVAGLAVVSILMIGSASKAQEKTWPRDFIVAEGKVVVYQPQLESFKGDKVSARAAVSVTKKGAKEPVFGVVWFGSRIITDRDTRTVEFQEVKVENMKFPNATPEQEAKLTKVIEAEIAKWPHTMSLDRLLAMTEAIEQEKVRADQLNNDPPAILFKTQPSVLVLLDGKPILRDVEGEKVQRVLNTPFVVLFDPSGSKYYLLGENLWFAASDVMGPWQLVSAPPDVVVAAAKKIAEAEVPSKVSAEAESGDVPEIIVATQPTELIVADGEPEFAPLAETNLLYMTNTGRDVFMPVGTNEYYVLLSGRWFKSSSLQNGPWAYVAPEKLPDGFYKIPPGSDKQHVLAFVPGTPDAEDAVAEAQIPQTAAIPRDSKISVQYDGEPKFDQVEGTQLQYATNTDKQVLKAKDAYYAVDKAAWYKADTPQGPYEVATSVPDEVEEIPPSSPVYNVKYVKVYEATPEVVYVGYTPGYTGTYVYGGTVVYGTGYVYRPYVSPRVYYPAPVTYGYAPYYNPYYGAWNFMAGATLGFVAGAVASNWWGHGGWHGYHGWHGHGGWHGRWDINRNVNININRNVNWRNTNWQMRQGPRAELYNNNLYKRSNDWSKRVQEDRRAQLRDQNKNREARRGKDDRMASREDRKGQGDRTGARQDRKGQRDRTAVRQDRQDKGDRASREGKVQKPGTGEKRPAGDRKGGQQRVSTREGQRKDRPAAGQSTGRDRTADRGANRAAQREMKKNNVFADRNGEVYRKGDQGWQKRDKSGWSKPESRSQVGGDRSRSNLDRDYRSRSRGAERSQKFQGMQGSRGGGGVRSSGGGRSGGSRGGGGGGRRR